jgi:hypothetical protein
MYEVKVELEHLRLNNIDFGQMIDYCDSLHVINQKAKTQLARKYDLRTQQYNNSLLIIEQEQEKFVIAEATLKSINQRKNLFVTTTIVAGVSLLLVLVLK